MRNRAQLRIAIADQRGDGRPDFAYQGRVLYADSVSPANVAATGGVVTITGMGFRAGNVVTVNGVAATVTNWTATSIVATVPSARALGFNTAATADVAVTDLSTGGTTVMSGALNYAAPLPSLNLVTRAVGHGVCRGYGSNGSIRSAGVGRRWSYTDRKSARYLDCERRRGPVWCLRRTYLHGDDRRIGLCLDYGDSVGAGTHYHLGGECNWERKPLRLQLWRGCRRLFRWCRYCMSLPIPLFPGCRR